MHILIAILSDIHGNLPALESVLNELRNDSRVEKIISLGDVSGYYPFINEVIELLRQHNVVNLIGNHDRYIIDNRDCPRSTSANATLAYQKNILLKENREWLEQSINGYRFKDVNMVHGGWNNPEDEYIYNVSAEYFNRFNEKFFFCGHTHVQAHFTLNGGKHFTNPGSVGQPRDGMPTAAYCLFDHKLGKIELKRIAYDIDRVAKKMKELGFEEKFYENLYHGTRIGGRVDTIELISLNKDTNASKK